MSEAKSERVQVVVPRGVLTGLQEIAEAENRTISNLCSGILSAWLESSRLRRLCMHKECVRTAMQHDILTLVCVDCGQTMQMTTDEARRRGTVVHARNEC